MANTLSAVYYPEGTDASILPLIAKNGAMLAEVLLPAIKTKYFRNGHMGMSDASEILATLGAIEQGLSSAGYSFEPGASLSAAQAALMQP